MDLTAYIESLRHHLLVAAEAGSEDARALAERLTAALDAATRLVLLDALSAAADEITRELAPGSVELRLRGTEPSFVVSPPPTEAAFDDPADALDGAWAVAGPDIRPPTPAAHVDGDEGGGTSRINLRLRDSLKLRAEQAADREGLSVNAWLVRAVAAALEPDGDRHARGRGPKSGQRYTGWVR